MAMGFKFPKDTTKKLLKVLTVQEILEIEEMIEPIVVYIYKTNLSGLPRFFRAHVMGDEGCFADGGDPTEALGNLVKRYPSRLKLVLDGPESVRKHLGVD